MLSRCPNRITCLFYFSQKRKQCSEGLNIAWDCISQVNICLLLNNESSLFPISRAGGQPELSSSLLGHCIPFLLFLFSMAQLHWQKSETDTTPGLSVCTESDVLDLCYGKLRAKRRSIFSNSVNNWISSLSFIAQYPPQKGTPSTLSLSESIGGCRMPSISSVSRLRDGSSLKGRKIPENVVPEKTDNQKAKTTLKSRD